MGWLDDYLVYTREQESPEEFHLWTGLTILAATLGRKVWLDRRSHGVTRYKIYPGQLMVVLVGPSGTQKTTAVEIGINNFLRKLGSINLIEDKITPEKLLRRLATLGPVIPPGGAGRVGPADAVATIYADELSVFLGRQTYADSMADILIKLYNAKDRQEIDSISGGLIVLQNVCTTIIATTTPIGLGESVSSKAHTTGYTARVHHVYAAKSQKVNPLTDLDDSEIDSDQVQSINKIESTLLDRLKFYQTLKGPCKYSKKGRQWYEQWYREWRKNPESEGEGWPSRRHDHLLRIAILLRVSAFGDLELDEFVLEAADTLLRKVELEHHHAFQYVGQSQIAKLQDKIVATIAANHGKIVGKVLYSRVRRYFDSINELKLALTTLHESGDIDRFVEKGVEYFSLNGIR